MKVSEDQLQVGKRQNDALESETKFPMILCRQLHIYSQILLATVNPERLQVGLAFYQKRLIGHLITCTSELVRLFHFAFRRGCIIDGMD